MKCREEIIPFKRALNDHKLSESRPEPHQFNRATEVFPKIFGGRNSHNKEEFKGIVPKVLMLLTVIDNFNNCQNGKFLVQCSESANKPN